GGAGAEPAAVCHHAAGPADVAGAAEVVRRAGRALRGELSRAGGILRVATGRGAGADSGLAGRFPNGTRRTPRRVAEEHGTGSLRRRGGDLHARTDQGGTRLDRAVAQVE